MSQKPNLVTSAMQYIIYGVEQIYMINFSLIRSMADWLIYWLTDGRMDGQTDWINKWINE